MDFSEIAQILENLSSTSKRLEKISIVSEFIRKTPKEDLQNTITLLRGTVFAAYNNQNIGFAAQTLVKTLASAYGYSAAEVTKEWKELGDLGDVAQSLCKKKRQQTLFSQSLDVQAVVSNLQQMGSISGMQAVSQKMQLAAELLGDAKPLEAKYLVRFLLEIMRAGLGESTLRDALIWAFFPKLLHINATQDDITQYDEARILDAQTSDDVILDNSLYDFDLIKTPDEKVSRIIYSSWQEYVQSGLDLTNDVEHVAQVLSKSLSDIAQLAPEFGKPLKVMLAQKVTSTTQAMEKLQTPFFSEFKYDGFRMQIHKKGDDVRLFTRRFEDVTEQFPDAVKSIKQYVKNDCILDAEAVGYDMQTQKYMPFQHISQRIRRKYDIEELAKKLPVEVTIFDILMIDEENTTKLPLTKRRELLNSIITPTKFELIISRGETITSAEQLQVFYDESLNAGNEGLMLKVLDSIYKPGSRVGTMIKLKPIMDTLDLVITRAQYGEGKRASWLSSFTVCCVDEEGELLEVGKVSSGLKEKEEEGVTFAQMTEMLQKIIVKEDGMGVEIKPSIIVEVAYEEIQKSTNYSSGFALRFPRILFVRDARGVESASTLKQVEDYFQTQ